MVTSATENLPEALRDLLPPDFISACRLLSCAKGDRLFRIGKTPTQMFYVSSGEVVLERLNLQGEAIVLQRVRNGFVAEASLQSSRYHCDARVTVSGDIISIPIESLRQSMLTDSAFALRWISMLNRELKRLRSQCERLSIKGVKGRLLYLIETEGDQGKLPLGAGLKSLASELGVTHEALYRTVAEMEKLGILRREDGYLCYS